jgi:hypothetical protein
MSNRKNSRAIPPDLQTWIDARRRHHLSHAHVQMARELGMNPKKLGKIDNHKQEPWKAPLPIFIETLYYKRFGRECPETTVTIEERAQQIAAKKAARRAAKATHRADAGGGGNAVVMPLIINASSRSSRPNPGEAGEALRGSERDDSDIATSPDSPR